MLRHIRSVPELVEGTASTENTVKDGRFDRLSDRLSKRLLWFDRLSNRLSKRLLSLSKYRHRS